LSLSNALKRRPRFYLLPKFGPSPVCARTGLCTTPLLGSSHQTWSAPRGIYNKYWPPSNMVANSLLEEPSRPRPANSIPDRQLRPRGSKAPLPPKSSSRSSTMPDMTGPHRRPSRSESLHLPADRVRMSNRSSAPMRTKTGRISKALKGLKVHECCQCGKV
jgi:hypothetical protein